MNKNKIKKLIWGTIVLFVLSIASLLVVFLVMRGEEEATIEHNATFVEIASGNNCYQIKIVEYSCCLIIEESEVINKTGLFNLTSGNVITFDVPLYYDELLENNQIQSIPIASLKTQTETIVSLESHKNAERGGFKKVQIAAAIGTSMFFCGAVVCLFLLIKQSMVKKP